MSSLCPVLFPHRRMKSQIFFSLMMYDSIIVVPTASILSPRWATCWATFLPSVGDLTCQGSLYFCGSSLDFLLYNLHDSRKDVQIHKLLPLPRNYLNNVFRKRWLPSFLTWCVSLPLCLWLSSYVLNISVIRNKRRINEFGCETLHTSTAMAHFWYCRCFSSSFQGRFVPSRSTVRMLRLRRWFWIARQEKESWGPVVPWTVRSRKSTPS